MCLTIMWYSTARVIFEVFMIVRTYFETESAGVIFKWRNAASIFALKMQACYQTCVDQISLYVLNCFYILLHLFVLSDRIN